MAKQKVLLLTNILAPYRVPLFNAMGQLFEDIDLELNIVFMAGNEENRRWKVRKDELRVSYETLPGWQTFLWRFEFPIHINPGIWNFLRKRNPDVIIVGGYALLSCWAALLFSKVFGKKIVLWTSTTPEIGKRRGLMRRAFRKIFINQSDAFVTYGLRAAAFLKENNIYPQSIFSGCNIGDMEFFKRAVPAYRATRQFLYEKARYSAPILLYVGQFIPRKGLLQLLLALKGIESRPWSLIMVGGGPLQTKIEGYIRRFGLENRVHVEPFREKEDLAKFYAISDIFVLPSVAEPYAIVVSEALASGLFMVCSKYAGAAWDLIEIGKNGLIMDPADIISMRSAIKKAIELVQAPMYSRERIVNSIKHLTIERYAKSFVNAIQYVLGKA
ncbi:MAG: glycosyltransferase family 4 protein [Candidatus Omnitrophica bacterium]|nr:glycosyltransferase family 4 protein [Candidatus Omnitrophota bacterium]